MPPAYPPGALLFPRFVLSVVDFSFMAIRGTVTKTNNGSHPWTGRYANGEPVGGRDFAKNFASLDEAQKVIEQSGPGGRRLRWTLENDPAGIESYRGEDP